MRPLVVIPTYNESENIERMLRRIHECLPGAGVLVVDDGSPDGTAEIVKKVRGRTLRHQRARAVRQVRARERVPGRLRLGLERGYGRLRRNRRRLLARPRCIADAHRAAQRGLRRRDRSRYVEGGSIPNWAWHRHLLSRGGNLYASGVLASACPTRRRGTAATRPAFCASSTSIAFEPRGMASRSK